MNKLRLLLLVLGSSIILSIAGCNWQDVKGSIISTSKEIETAYTLKIPKTNINKLLQNRSPRSLKWLTKKYGKNHRFYRVKMRSHSLSKSQINSLILHAYQGDKRAIAALEATLYRDLLSQKNRSKAMPYRKILYHDKFLHRGFKESQELIAYIPEKHERYSDLAVDAVNQNPKSFYWLTIKTKQNPKVIQALFDYDLTYDNANQHLAIKYAGPKQRFLFLKRNGLLIQHLSDKDRQNKNIVYAAVIQNHKAMKYAPQNLQSAINKIGILNIKAPSTVFFLIDYKVRPILKIIKESIAKKLDPIFGSNAKAKEKTEKTQTINPKIGSIDRRVWVIRNKPLIKKIEAAKGWRLLHLWQIAKFAKGELYIGNFKPKDNHYMGALIYKKGDKIAYADYPAIYSLDGKSIWRIGDKGVFDPKSFELVSVESTKSGVALYVKWKGLVSNNLYKLQRIRSKLRKQKVTIDPK